MRALVIGATGLVGRAFVSLALEDAAVTKVISLVRRKGNLAHAKLEEHVVDFAKEETWPALEADALFSTLGTTVKIAGTREAQREVDYGIQYRVAAAAAKAGVPTYVLVSSLGANADAMSAYSKMKGELDRDVQKLGFARVRILRPSMLVGDRDVTRPGERIGETLLNAVAWIPGISKLRPIEGTTVAAAMLRAARDSEPGVKFLENAALFA